MSVPTQGYAAHAFKSITLSSKSTKHFQNPLIIAHMQLVGSDKIPVVNSVK